MAISNSHAKLLAAPGMGHIIPALELAKRLVTHHIIPKITFFYGSIKNSTPSKAETLVLQLAIKENLFDIIQLPPLDLTNLVGPNITLKTTIATIMHETPLLVLSTISTMHLNPTIIITDFYVSFFSPTKNLKVPKFAFAPTNAWVLALGLYSPTLDKEDRTHRLYHEFVGPYEEAALADGILVNTFHELEPKTLEAFGNGLITKVPVYPVGPIVRERSQSSEEGKRSDVVEWLDKQKEESVIYVSLGSAYTMSCEEIKEMALGLELSGNKFVWSMRPPLNKSSNDHYFTAGEKTENGTTGVSNSDPSNSFPEEFYRIQTNGIVTTDWAPQLDILKHPSIGGFVSHCGWNSVIESVSCGVPIVAWPLYAEQRMNATMLEEEIGNAIRVEVSLSTNMLEKEKLAKAIRKIMDKENKEGCAIRKRAKELKDLAEKAWCHDGSSYLALSKISHSNGVW